MAYPVRLSRSARRDLEEIVRYISLDDAGRAAEFGRLLIEKAKALGDFPEIGRVVPELGDPTVREIIVRHYRVIYRLNPAANHVDVIRFWHAARGLPPSNG